MFYSQFILAKKGPLGTIWIAAHLERKLKKNQVADTDIGVSVDSILFPEVPIALRLSSHLLLGVVRIYSRKVNYLFHDCSEALLKVKQAFRSTAVDLPPEESTAPYHSITLPETFDLDDFELPDSALLHGNFDDRHVSTREQITLQDNLDGTGYSTSQFGLDERFGDGDASQMGLDLDEELLLNNNLTLQDASVLDGAVHQGEGASDLTKTGIEEDGHYHEDRNDEASTELSELLGGNRGKHVLSDVENIHRNDDSSHRLIFNIQTPDLNEIFLPDDDAGGSSAVHDMEMDFAAADPPSPEFNEPANFPATPGLLEEATGTNSQGVPTSNPQKIQPDTAPETDKFDMPLNQVVECPDATNGLINAVAAVPKVANLAQVVSSPTSVLGEAKPDPAVPIHDDGRNHTECNVQSTSSSLVLTEPASDVLALQPSGETAAAADTGPVLRKADILHTGIIRDEANGQPVPPDNSLVPQTAEAIEVPHEDSMGLPSLDQGRVEDAKSCQTSNFSALSSDFLLRSCTSQSSHTNLIPSCNMVQEIVEREQPCNLETSLKGREINFSGSSVDPRGFCPVISTDTNLRVDQNSNGWLLGLRTGISNPVELSSTCNPKDVQSGHWNCFSSSEFSEPERIRFAASGNINISNDLGQQTMEKGVIESDGSVDRISNLSGHKRRLVDVTPHLQNDVPPKTLGIPRKKWNNEYVPDDDDLLASILVGRQTSAVRIGPTPPLPKPPLKRPRLAAKAGLPKRRKVLLDDTIVLHADAIRQQLINTEDIRRMRKKAPCTRPEIWRIHKSSLEDDIFCESIFTGVSEDLNRLFTRTYNVAQNVYSEINAHNSIAEGSKEVELPKSSVVRGSDGQEMAEQNIVVTKKGDGEMQVPSGVSELIEAESCRNVVPLDAQGCVASPLDLHHVDLPQNTISRAELDPLGDSGTVPARCAAANSGSENKQDDMCTAMDQSSPNMINNSHDLLEANNSILPVAEGALFGNFTSADPALAVVDNNTSLEGKDFSDAKATSITVEDMGVDTVNVDNLECPQDGSANRGKDDSGGVAVSTLDRIVVEVGEDFPVYPSSVIKCVDASVPDMVLAGGGPAISDYQAMKSSEAEKDTAGHEPVMDEEKPASDIPDGERAHVDSFPVPHTESERVPSAVGENSCLNIEGGLDVESSPMEFAATRESSDFCSAIDDIDTDFLNVDDDVDEYEEAANDDVPNTEEAQSLENSGWSSRTRGVARYLKNMFDQESGRGRKFVAIDHLLAGKTRKEASRMFFETLVLKTRDYIHVEQENPFDCIIIKPRIKLLKSEF